MKKYVVTGAGQGIGFEIEEFKGVVEGHRDGHGFVVRDDGTLARRQHDGY